MNAPAFLDQGTHPRRRRDAVRAPRIRRRVAASGHRRGERQSRCGELPLRLEGQPHRGGVPPPSRRVERAPHRCARSRGGLAAPSPELEDVLGAFIRPALELSLDEAGGHAFMRVLARAYAEHDERLRKFLSDNYGHVLREFAGAFARLLPASWQGRAVLAPRLHHRRPDPFHGRLRSDEAARHGVGGSAPRARRRAPDPLRRRGPARAVSLAISLCLPE